VLADLSRTSLDVGVSEIETPSYSTYVQGTKLTIVGWATAAVSEAVFARRADIGEAGAVLRSAA